MPTGEQVIAGQATVKRAGSGTLITQTSDRAAIDWQGFNIGVGESVRFAQPSATSITLNRVLGQKPTDILGSLQANGQVFVLNANGVLFGRTAQVDVGGLLASTLGLASADFMAGRYHFAGLTASPEPAATIDGTAGPSLGEVSNRGKLSANGGYVALLGRQVRNEGSIVARQGQVLLAAGETMVLNIQQNRLLGFTVGRGVVNALVANQGIVQANGGRIVLTAKAADQLIRSVVNNDGVLEAQTLARVGGSIQLLAVGGEVQVGGKLDASAPAVGGASGAGGDGGFIETSGDKVAIGRGAVITTLASQGRTGTWLIDPNDFTIAASGGNLTGSSLGSLLDSNNVTITTDNQGSAGGHGDIFVNDQVAWSAATGLTLTAERHVDFSGGGALLARNAGSRVDLGAGNAGLNAVGAVIAHPDHIAVSAGSLRVTASSGIGNSAAPLRTQVSHLLLVNRNAGGQASGIHALNTGDVTLAGSNVNGDIDVHTADGAGTSGNGEDAAAGGNIRVGTVDGVAGLSTTDNGSGQGHIILATGRGGRAYGDHAAGGAGGSIVVDARLSAAQSATLSALDGNQGGFRGVSGAGGSITLNAALSAGQSATLTAGQGSFLQAETHDFRFDLGGAAGGSITLNAPLSTAGSALLTAGRGGSGGIHPAENRSTGPAGTGGSIILNGGALDVAQTATLKAGDGGWGGDGRHFGSRGGDGGSIQMDAAAAFAGDAVLIAGTGSPGDDGGFFRGSPGQNGAITGRHLDLSAAGSLSIEGIVSPSWESAGGSGIVSLKAGLNPGALLRVSGDVGGPSRRLSLQGYHLDIPGPLGADLLSITTATGIGSAARPLRIGANQMALTSTDSGGIFVTSSHAATIAAASHDGDIVIRTADATAPGYGGTYPNITVGTVLGLSGITTTGSGPGLGNITLIAGHGLPDGNCCAGTGGSITVNAPVNAAQAVTLTAGHGAYAALGALEAEGGRPGGSIMLNAPLNAATTATLTAGGGGVGGKGLSSGADPGGAGGAIVLKGLLQAQQSLTLTAGSGGEGSIFNPAVGGNGGTGGSIQVDVAQHFAANARLTPGAGGPGAPGTLTAGAAGAAGVVTGKRLDLSATGSLDIDGAVSATAAAAGGSGDIRLQAGQGPGAALTVTGPLSTSDEGANLTLQGYSVSLPGHLTADRLRITSATGIGAPDKPLQATVRQMALDSTGSGGIYVTNLGDLVVAAASADGDIDIRTANGAPASGNRQDAVAGGDITVATVADLVGIATSDSGSGNGQVMLTAGWGGLASGAGGMGGAGGSIWVNQGIHAAQAATLSAGGGNRGGSGGGSGVGGSIRLNAPLAAMQAATLSAGDGAAAPFGPFPNQGGGAGGAIQLNAALVTSGSASLTAGRGGNGGSSNGSAGASGGSITLNGVLDVAGNAALTSGPGGVGGGGGLGIAGNGGAGGAIDVDLAQTFVADAVFALGAGGPGAMALGHKGANGADGMLGGKALAIDAAGSLSIGGGVRPTPVVSGGSGRVSLKAGLGPDKTLRLTGPVTAADDGSRLDLQGYRVILDGHLTADRLDITTATGIGTPASPLQTTVGQMALTSQGSGGIHVVNVGNLTLAAASSNGDVDIRTISGTDGSAGLGGTAGTLTIGSVSALTGVTAGSAAKVSLVAGQAVNGAASNLGGDIVLDATVASASSGDAIGLAGHRLINNAGATALLADQGRWLIWSGDPARDRLGGLRPDFKQYNAIFGSGAAAQAAGNGLLYTLAPVLVPSLTGSVVKVYDGDARAGLTAANLAVSGAVDGDIVVLRANGQYDTRNAGSAKTVTATDIGIASATSGGATVHGYQLLDAAAAPIGTISPRTLRIAADDQTMFTFDPLPPFTASYIGLATPDSPATLVGSLGFTTPATANSLPGVYPITPFGQSSGNYAIRFVDGALTVTLPALPSPLQSAVATVQATAAQVGDLNAASAALPWRPDPGRARITVSGIGIKMP